MARQIMRLPPQQSRVVRLYASGLCTKEIAKELGITIKTVAYHVACLPRWLRSPVVMAHAMLCIGHVENLFGDGTLRLRK